MIIIKNKVKNIKKLVRVREVKIFATKRRITKPTEVDKLVEKGLLPKTVNRNSGPNLITKLKLSMVEDKNGETAYMRFFNPPAINPKTGKINPPKFNKQNPKQSYKRSSYK